MSEAPPPDGGAPAPQAKPRRRLSGRKKAAFAVALLLGPPLLLELGLRLCGWPTQQIRSVSRLINFDRESFASSVGVFRPGARSRISWPPQLAYTAQINALGLRGPETTRQPAPGAFRVLAVGDSTTFGYYVEEPDTLPQRLQDELRRGDAAQLEVVNGGCGGWTIAGETQWFVERGVQLEPDLVLLSFCSNDIPELQRPQSNYQNQLDLLDQEGSWLKEAAYATATYELALRIRIAWKDARLRARGEQPHPLSSIDVAPERLDELWSLYERYLRELRDACRSRQTPLVVAYLPDAYRIQERQPQSDDLRLAQLCERLGIPYVSTTPRFEARPVTELFHAPLDAHLSAAGNAAAAEVIAAFLRERSLLAR